MDEEQATDTQRDDLNWSEEISREREKVFKYLRSRVTESPPDKYLLFMGARLLNCTPWELEAYENWRYWASLAFAYHKEEIKYAKEQASMQGSMHMNKSIHGEGKLSQEARDAIFRESKRFEGR